MLSGKQNDERFHMHFLQDISSAVAVVIGCAAIYLMADGASIAVIASRLAQ